MNKTVGGHWANLASHSYVMYLERGLGDTPEVCRALIEQLIEGVGRG